MELPLLFRLTISLHPGLQQIFLVGCCCRCVHPQAVRAIGRCAVSLEKAAQRCISVLLELIQTKVNYVVQEAVIVIKVGGLNSLIILRHVCTAFANSRSSQQQQEQHAQHMLFYAETLC